MATKYCGRCKQIKPIEEFGKCRTYTDGLSFYCKACIRADANRLRQANQERYRRYNREYHQRHISGAKTPEGRFHRLKQHAKRKGIPVLLTLETFRRWFNSQKLECHYCGQPLILGNGSTDVAALNIDRKDNKQGYSLENIVLACRRCNSMKGDWLTAEQTKEIAERYFKPELRG
jgi:5-methylcytosine-specific restriction endonuclease McrA